MSPYGVIRPQWVNYVSSRILLLYPAHLHIYEAHELCASHLPESEGPKSEIWDSISDHTWDVTHDILTFQVLLPE